MELWFEFLEPQKKLPNPRWFLPAVILFLILVISIVLAHADTVLTASWYSNQSLIKEGTWKNGKECLMANGQRFNENALTCASRLYDLGTLVKVTNIQNGKSVVVKVTDRIGKRFKYTRIDLSKKAFMQIANLDRGITRVRVEVVE